MKKLIIFLLFDICCLIGFSQKTGTFTDTRDGKTYKTVKIGSQWIMAENLAYKPAKGKFWAIKNNEANTPKYGYLYTWDAAISIAPNGWHLPSIEEWDKLYKYLGENDDVLLPGGGSGFNLVFPGVHGVFGFMLIDETAMFRSSTPYWSFQVNGYVYSSETYKNNDNAFKNAGISVRLFKDLSDSEMWDWAKIIDSKQEYLNFLNSYPSSIYADSARVILAQIEEIGVAKIKEKELKKRERLENYKKLRVGMTPNEIVSLFGFDDEINTTRFGGIFVGIGLLPNEENGTKVSYTGNAVFEGYSFTFLNGQLTEWQLVQSETDAKTYHGECDGSLGTTTIWTVSGDKYNIEVKTK